MGLSLVVMVKPRPFSPLTKVTATVCVAPEMGLVLGLTGTSMPDIARSPLPTRNVLTVREVTFFHCTRVFRFNIDYFLLESNIRFIFASKD